MSALLDVNKLSRAHYAEPYAGGASLALSLLRAGKVSEIHLNDLDRSVWAFWRSLLQEPNEFIARVRSTPVSIDEWHRQRGVQGSKATAAVMDLGFSTFFLNRTNRSGILTAGVIGGKLQSGPWRLDARFNKEDLIRRLKEIVAQRSQIHLTRLDALTFIARRNTSLPRARSLMYLDPPYFAKGQDLYMNAYMPADHARVATAVTETLELPWIVSYDDVPEIRSLYSHSRRLSYTLRYSASATRRGHEVIFLRKGLRAKPSLLQCA